MTLVLVFLLLLLAVVGTTFRQAGAVLRLEAVRSAQVLRDEGSLRAVARCVAMLENGPPPTDPYAVTLGVSTSAGPRSYVVTIASDPSGANLWTVNAVPAPAGP
jgi:hypothetical protein